MENADIDISIALIQGGSVKMASSVEYIEFVCEQIAGVGDIRYKKMFGEYMIYVNDKPVLLVCNDTVFVKIKDETTILLAETETGIPYKGAKEHYILDIEDRELAKEVVLILEKITPIPKPRKKKSVK